LFCLRTEFLIVLQLSLSVFFPKISSKKFFWEFVLFSKKVSCYFKGKIFSERIEFLKFGSEEKYFENW